MNLDCIPRASHRFGSTNNSICKTDRVIPNSETNSVNTSRDFLGRKKSSLLSTKKGILNIISPNYVISSDLRQPLIKLTSRNVDEVLNSYNNSSIKKSNQSIYESLASKPSHNFIKCNSFGQVSQRYLKRKLESQSIDFSLRRPQIFDNNNNSLAAVKNKDVLKSKLVNNRSTTTKCFQLKSLDQSYNSSREFNLELPTLDKNHQEDLLEKDSSRLTKHKKQRSMNIIKINEKNQDQFNEHPNFLHTMRKTEPLFQYYDDHFSDQSDKEQVDNKGYSDNKLTFCNKSVDKIYGYHNQSTSLNAVQNNNDISTIRFYSDKENFTKSQISYQTPSDYTQSIYQNFANKNSYVAGYIEQQDKDQFVSKLKRFINNNKLSNVSKFHPEKNLGSVTERQKLFYETNENNNYKQFKQSFIFDSSFTKLPKNIIAQQKDLNNYFSKKKEDQFSLQNDDRNTDKTLYSAFLKELHNHKFSKIFKEKAGEVSFKKQISKVNNERKRHSKSNLFNITNSETTLMMNIQSRHLLKKKTEAKFDNKCKEKVNSTPHLKYTNILSRLIMNYERKNKEFELRQKFRENYRKFVEAKKDEIEYFEKKKSLKSNASTKRNHCISKIVEEDFLQSNQDEEEIYQSEINFFEEFQSEVPNHVNDEDHELEDLMIEDPTKKYYSERNLNIQFQSKNEKQKKQHTEIILTNYKEKLAQYEMMSKFNYENRLSNYKSKTTSKFHKFNTTESREFERETMEEVILIKKSPVKTMQKRAKLKDLNISITQRDIVKCNNVRKRVDMENFKFKRDIYSQKPAFFGKNEAYTSYWLSLIDNLLEYEDLKTITEANYPIGYYTCFKMKYTALVEKDYDSILVNNIEIRNLYKELHEMRERVRIDCDNQHDKVFSDNPDKEKELTVHEIERFLCELRKTTQSYGITIMVLKHDKEDSVLEKPEIAKPRVRKSHKDFFLNKK